MCLWFIQASVVLCFHIHLTACFYWGVTVLPHSSFDELAPGFQSFPEMFRQGVLGQLKFTCSNSNQIPGESTRCCIRASFKEKSSVVIKHYKTESISLCFQIILQSISTHVANRNSVKNLYSVSPHFPLWQEDECIPGDWRKNMWTMTGVCIPQGGQSAPRIPLQWNI